MTYRASEVDLIQHEVITFLQRKARKTPLKLVDSDGNVVGEVDPVQRSLEILTKAGFIFEHEVGRMQTVCAGWHGICPNLARPSKKMLQPWSIRNRKGKPWMCAVCAKKRGGETLSEHGLGPSRKSRTCCQYGHPYDGQNTLIKQNGARRCRLCHAASERKRKKRIMYHGQADQAR